VHNFLNFKRESYNGCIWKKNNTLLVIFGVAVLGVIMFVSGVGDEVFLSRAEENQNNSLAAFSGFDAEVQTSIVDRDIKLLQNLNHVVARLRKDIDNLYEAIGLEPSMSDTAVSENISSIKTERAQDGRLLRELIAFPKTISSILSASNIQNLKTTPQSGSVASVATLPASYPIVVIPDQSNYQVYNVLTWQDNATDEEVYVVARRLPGTSFTPIAYLPKDSFYFFDSFLVEGGFTYIYTVGAVNKYKAGYSQEVYVTSTAPKTPYGMTPQNLTGTVLSPFSVSLTWYDNISVPESWYYVFRTESIATGASVIGWFPGGNPGVGQMNFTDTTAKPNTRYWYFIGAELPGTVFTAFPDSNIFEVFTPPDPQAPKTSPSTILGIGGGGATTPGNQIFTHLDFIPVSNEKGYSIERSVGNTQNFVEIQKKNEPQPIPFAVDKNVQPATKYYYRVRAYNDYGFGGYSPILPVTFP